MRPVPDDFDETCRTMSIRLMIPHYKTSQKTITKWFKARGIDPQSVRGYVKTKCMRKPMPDDFAHYDATMTLMQMTKHFGSGKNTINRWRWELRGVDRSDGPRLRGLNVNPVPDDFHARGPALTLAQAAREYGVHYKVAGKWFEALGIAPAKHRPPSISIPGDFDTHAAAESNAELMARFGVSGSLITAWRKARGIAAPHGRTNRRYLMPTDKSTTGGRRITFNRPGPQAAPDSGRDDSPVGLAVEYMRSGSRGWRITRCDADGTFNPRGDHYRCGTMELKTADEMMAWARDKGWKLVDIFSIAA